MDPVFWALLGMAGVIVIIVIVLMLTKNHEKVGPNEALIVFGGREHSIEGPAGQKVKVGYRIEIGGGTFVNPFTEKAETLSLEVHNIVVSTPEVLTAEGVPLTAVGTCQVRIGADEWMVHLGAQHFLGQEPDVIREVSISVVEGHMRNQMGARKVEQIYQDRMQFTQAVRESAQADLAKMGLQMVSFALSDISDSQGYLDALGKPRISEVKRDAAIAQAEADRDSAIKSAEARKEGEIARLEAEAKIAGRNWLNEGLKAESMTLVNKKKAIADLAYELERHHQTLEVKKEEFNVRQLEKEQAAQLEKLEIGRRELELDSTVKKPAEARMFQIRTEADAEAYRMRVESTAKSEAAKMDGVVEAERVKSLGLAEAEALTQKANAFKQYNNAAMVQMVMDKLPEITRAAAEPLSNVDRIVMIGNDGKGGPSDLTGQVTKIVSQVPDVVEALTGIDLKKMITKKLGGDDE